MNPSNQVSKIPILAICLAAAADLSPLAHGQSTAAPDVPIAINAPSGQRLIWRAHASGVQIYVCEGSTDGKVQWMLKGPEAELRDDSGVLMGSHYAGPTWKHKDGSEVVGKPTARADSPDPGAVPWLLLTAVSHSGQGTLSRVTSIQRIHTKGGQAPATPCNASNSGVEVKSPYTADY
jgi:hypothetical protein